MTATNPFFEISLLPYQAPHFDQINDSHYRPALTNRAITFKPSWIMKPLTAQAQAGCSK